MKKEKRPSPYANMKSDRDRLRETVMLTDQARRMEKTAHEKEMKDLRAKLHERELDMKCTIVRSCAQLMDSLARMIGGPGF